MRARFNRALQIESDGFCRLPAHHPALASQGSSRPHATLS
jgi:hypothetical protein